MPLGDVLDTINDDIAMWVNVFRNNRNPVSSEQTNAAVYLAQQRSQQQTIVVLGLAALGLFAMTRK